MLYEATVISGNELTMREQLQTCPVPQALAERAFGHAAWRKNPHSATSAVEKSSSSCSLACRSPSATNSAGRASTCAPQVTRTVRNCCCAIRVPQRPAVTPVTAQNLPLSGEPAGSRLIQSTAFLVTPGSDWLYSGVAK